MEEEPVHVIRESSRSLLKLNRRVHRDKQTDDGRNLEKTGVTEETIVHIVDKLKVKSAITAMDLNILKNAILNDPKYTTIVLSTQGSLRGLVREISGTDVKRQIAAAGCCCNLALSDAKTCMTIAKAAGPYLTTSLDNLNTEIAVTCGWALGNLAGAGAKVGATLSAMGALAKLTVMLSSPHEEVRDAALYALAHIAYQMRDSFDKEHMEKLVQALLDLKLNMASTQVLFILSCHNDFALSPEELHKVLDSTSVTIEKHCKECPRTSDVCCEIVYLVRILANSDMSQTGMVILNYFESNVNVEYFKTALKSNNCVLVESLYWLLGNLYNCCGESNLITMLLKDEI